MDGPPALALGVDPAGDATMRRPPRSPDERVLGGARLWRALWAGAVMCGGTLGVLAVVEGPRASTAAFTVFVLFQVAHALATRLEGAGSACGPRWRVRSRTNGCGPRSARSRSPSSPSSRCRCCSRVSTRRRSGASTWALCAGVAATIFVTDGLFRIVVEGRVSE